MMMMYQNIITLVGLWCFFLVVSELVCSFMGLPNQFFITLIETDIQQIQPCQTMSLPKYQSIYQCFIGVNTHHHSLIRMKLISSVVELFTIQWTSLSNDFLFKVFMAGQYFLSWASFLASWAIAKIYRWPWNLVFIRWLVIASSAGLEILSTYFLS